MTVILCDCCLGMLRVTVGWQSDNTRYTCASGEKALASTIFVVNLRQEGLSWQSYEKSGYPKTLEREMELAKTKFTFRSVCLIWDLQEHKSKRTIKQVKKSLSASIRSLSSKIPDQFATWVETSVEKYRLSIYRVFLANWYQLFESVFIFFGVFKIVHFSSRKFSFHSKPVRRFCIRQILARK